MKKEAKYLGIINDERTAVYGRRIEALMVGQKKYKEKEYSVSRLAKDLSTNSRYVSVAIRKSFGQNYSQYVNRLRVEEAKELLRNPDLGHLRMEDVGDMVGFVTRQTFQTTFQRLVGMTPLQFRNHERV